MALQSTVRTASIALAGSILAVVAIAFAGVRIPLPAPPGGVGSAVPFLAVPLALAGTVWARAALSGKPTDLVLALFSVPCLLAALGTGYQHYAGRGGVYWGEFLVLGTGILLAIAVVADAAVRVRLASGRPTT